MEVQPRNLETYVTDAGRRPFTIWLDSLRDQKAISKIDARLERVKQGNLGDFQSVGDGVFELRIDYGPGYRVYFAQVGLIVVLLLCGGDKSSQDQDIRKAKEYWADYENRQQSSE
jgi:putative addiction module killer protein